MNIAIILSGGIGSRMGKDIPKQYLKVNNRPIILFCLSTFLNNDNIDAIVIGVADEWKDYVSKQIETCNVCKPIYFTEPGETRQYSIYNALNLIRELRYKENDIVIIHDAARPLISNDLINKCLSGCRYADGIMPVIPVKDTIYLSRNAKEIDSLLNRNHLWAGQAPEAFVFGKYLKIHETISREDLLKINGSTEIAYQAGLKIKLIEGDVMNFKITTPEDLSNFENIISQQNESI